MRAHVSMVALLVVAAACTDASVSGQSEVGEPIVVVSAQFLPGSLPGLPPPDASTDAGPSPGPQVTDINVASTAIFQGEQGFVMSGHATIDSQTMAVRIADLGSGYWVVPVGAPDPSDNGLLTWQLTADFARNLPPGFHNLLFTALNAAGASGVQADLSICIDTPVPDNLNICVPRRAPPAAVLSLSWDAPVELNIIVQTPSGTMIGESHTTAPAADGGGTTSSTSSAMNGVIDHASNLNCVIDNIDREDVVWQQTPESGTYQVWVNLVRACGQPSVDFNVSLWLSEPRPDAGTQELVAESPPLATGELTAIQANGGTSLGLFVGSFVLQ